MITYEDIYRRVEWSRSCGSKTLGAVLPPLIIAYQARTVINIGIANGFTDQVLALALTAVGADGLVLSCDFNPQCATIGRQTVEAVGVKAEVLCCDSAKVNWAEVVRRHDRAGAEISVVDGDHKYLPALTDLRAVGPVTTGLILAHDHAPGQPGVMRAVENFCKESDWTAISIPESRPTGDIAFAILQRRLPHA